MNATERREFFKAIGSRADLVELETKLGRYLLSTKRAEDEEFYVTQTSKEVELLAQATHAMAKAGLPPGGDVVLITDDGQAAVTAVASLGYERAIVCIPELARCRLVRLNAVLNGVTDRVAALPVYVSGADTPDEGVGRTEVRSIDQLCARGLIDPERIRLLVAATPDHGAVLHDSAALTEAGIPLALGPRVAATTSRLNQYLSERYARMCPLDPHEAAPDSDPLEGPQVLEAAKGDAVLLTAESGDPAPPAAD